MTKTVEANNSFRVDQETLLNSLLTSLRKFLGFAKIFINLKLFNLAAHFLKTTGAAGLEPAVTVLETVGLPLTDAPKFLISLFPTHILA